MLSRKIFLFGLTVFLGIALITFAWANDQPAPPRGTISLENLTFSGSGCSPDTVVTTEIGESLLELQLTTPALTALIDPLNRKAKRDNCIVILDIVHPQGWQFAISNVVNRSGYARLAQGVFGNVRSDYYFQGTPTQATFELTIKGPYVDTFSFHGELLSGEELFSECGGGRSLVLNNEVQINPEGSLTAEMTDNTIATGNDDLAVFVYGIQWRQC